MAFMELLITPSRKFLYFLLLHMQQTYHFLFFILEIKCIVYKCRLIDLIPHKYSEVNPFQII